MNNTADSSELKNSTFLCAGGWRNRPGSISSGEKAFMTENKANAGGAPVATAAELLSPIERVGPAKKKSKIG